MMSLRSLKNLERDDLLDLIGLQSRKDTVDYLLPALGLFGLGLAVGAGLGLMLAPKSGRKLREDLRTRLRGDESSNALPTSMSGSDRPARAL